MTESWTIAKGYIAEPVHTREIPSSQNMAPIFRRGAFFGTSDDHFDEPAAQMGGVAKKKNVIDDDRTGFDSLTMRANYQGDS